MSMKSTRIVLCVVLAVCAIWSKGAQASSTAQKVRDKLEAQSLRKTNRLPAVYNRQLKSACSAYFLEIKHVHHKHRCSGSCRDKIKAYDQALLALLTRLERASKEILAKHVREALSTQAILGICLMVAIRQKDHVASYGVGRMMMQGKRLENRLAGGMWSVTSLALGKGVTQSKAAAVALLMDLAKTKETDKKTRTALVALAAQLILEK